MQKVEPSWVKNGDWKQRYSKLYSSQRISVPKEDVSRRISFMSDMPNASQTSHLISVANKEKVRDAEESPRYFTTLLSHRSELYGSTKGSQNMSDDLGGHETLLLDMVRAKSRELEEEALDQTLELPRDDVSDVYDQLNESCVHGLSWRMTERSVSRSRVSKISTRRDMDIPSILAFTTTATPAPAALGISAFQRVNETPQEEEIPRWSIRRSVCPVCSQKWRDKSSINNVKYSGLKRNTSLDLPSVSAPARLRTSIMLGYAPRPSPATIDEEHGGFRNSSTTWQLTRARRFRAPKPQMPPPEATAPPIATAPMLQKDLDNRVSRFLTDTDVKRIL